MFSAFWVFGRLPHALKTHPTLLVGFNSINLALCTNKHYNYICCVCMWNKEDYSCNKISERIATRRMWKRKWSCSCQFYLLYFGKPLKFYNKSIRLYCNTLLLNKIINYYYFCILLITHIFNANTIILYIIRTMNVNHFLTYFILEYSSKSVDRLAPMESNISSIRTVVFVINLSDATSFLNCNAFVFFCSGELINLVRRKFMDQVEWNLRAIPKELYSILGFCLIWTVHKSILYPK